MLNASYAWFFMKFEYNWGRTIRKAIVGWEKNNHFMQGKPVRKKNHALDGPH